MPLRLKSLSLGWLIGTGLAIVGGGGYLIYDTMNPRVSQWLLGSGYILNPPQLTSHESKDNYCSENLFKQDSNFENEKVYACRAAGINIWNDGDHFDNKSVDYVIWTDKLTIRKGNEGWQITELVNSLAGAVKYIQLTTYTNKQGTWELNQTFIGSTGLKKKTNKETIENSSIVCNTKDNQPNILFAERDNKFLKFLVNGVEWYAGKQNSSQTSLIKTRKKSNKEEELSEVFQKGKSDSWIWLEDKNSSEKLLENTGSFQYSQKDMIEVHRLIGCYNLFFGKDKSLRQVEASSIILTYKDIRQWTNKGHWISTEEVCGLANKRKWSVNEDQRKNLKLFCAKSKSEE